jgi:hypothetical protein
LIQKDKETQESDTIASILFHTGSTLKNSIINHAMIITNVEKFTGLRFVSKCVLEFRTSDHHRDRFTKHYEECDGKFHKKLKLNSSLALILHFMKNKTLQYMLAHKIELKKYRPVSSYITHDF